MVLQVVRELELAANQAKSENQAEFVPGPDHTEKKMSNFFFQKIKPKTFTQKDIGIRACVAKIRCVSLLTLTVKHPVTRVGPRGCFSN